MKQSKGVLKGPTFGPMAMDMLLGGTFEIGTQIILLQIDGFLRGWILNITPLKILPNLFWADILGGSTIT